MVEYRIDQQFSKAHHDIPSTPTAPHLSSLLLSLLPPSLLPSSLIKFQYPYLQSDAHLLGQHTIHMSPISTATLNPYSHTFCLSPHIAGGTVLVPILLNNTDVGNVRYTITPLGAEGEGAGKVEYVELGARELKAIEAGRAEGLLVARPGGGTANGGGSAEREIDDDEYDEYDDSDADEQHHPPPDSDPNASSHNHHHHHHQPPLQKTQSITHIRLKKPGTVHLERVLDASSNTAARLVQPVALTVVPCPTAEFVPDQVETVRCASSNSKGQFMIDIRGVPPLSLRWYKEVNGRREHFLVEGIEGEHPQPGDDPAELPLVVGAGGRRKSRVPRELKIPLEVSLDAVGSHTYVLEEIIDGLNNAAPVEHSHNNLPIAHKLAFGLGLTPPTHEPPNAAAHHHHPDPKTTRSLSVLRRPSISFVHCAPGTPIPLLIGSEAPLTISAGEADPTDAPWDVEVVYRPFDGDGSGEGGKRYKAWKKSLTTLKGKSELSLRASAPGEYTIVGVKGKVGLMLRFRCLFEGDG